MKPPPSPDTSVPAALRDAYLAHVKPGQGLLLGVSGGLDSTALLIATADVRASLDLRVEVATLDHGLRPESAGEASEVRIRAERLGLLHHLERLRVPRSGNLEAQARAARYAALEALRGARGLDWVVTAHTASDQAETLLMRLARGSALRGAGAIQARWGRVLRPMLGLTRPQVRAYLEAAGAGYSVDPMNADRRFLRSRVRHELLPVLQDLAGPDVERRLARFALQAAEDEQWMNGHAQVALERLTLPGRELDGAGLAALEPPLRRRVLRGFLESHGVSPTETLLLRAELALREGGACSLPGRAQLDFRGGRVRRQGAELVVLPEQDLAYDALQVGTWELRLCPEPPAVEGYFWPLPHEGPWRVRTRRPGDRVEGHGGARRLQDLFVNGRVPREARSSWPLVCDAKTGRVTWAVGLWPRNDGDARGMGVFARRVDADGKRR